MRIPFDEAPAVGRSWPKRRALLGLLGAVAAVSGAHAESHALRPGIIGEDNRVRVEQRGAPWDAIGQVNVGGYRRVGQCTGTLIAPDVVLTAAHCVVDPWRGAPFPLHDIHFLAGVRGGENKGHSTAKCLRFPSAYKFEQDTTDFATDMAEIVLNEKLDVGPMPLGEDVEPRAGLSLIHAAYPADKRFALAAHFGCKLLRADGTPPVWFTDCDTHPASSGGPVLTEVGGKLELVAVMVAAGNGSPNLAVPLSMQSTMPADGSCQ